MGTRGERAASGRFAEGESEAEVASLTSIGRGSGLCADQDGRAEGRREAASDPQVRSEASRRRAAQPATTKRLGSGATPSFHDEARGQKRREIEALRF